MILKDKIKKTNRQITEWKKIIVRISNKGLELTKHKELLNNKK